MNEPRPDLRTAGFRMAAMLLIVLATAAGAGRLMSAQKLNEPSLAAEPGADPDVDRRPKWPATRPAPMPTFSSNDRSRWATVRALVDEGTFVVGRRKDVEPVKEGDPTYRDEGIIFEDGWGSIDKVMRPGTNEFYSSKPPLLSVLVAGIYWLVKSLFGWTLFSNPFPVVRLILMIINIVPFFFYLCIIDRWAARFSRDGWTRLVVLVAAGFGTTVTPFLITFNNHTIGTFCVLFALDALFVVWERRGTPWTFARAGLFAAFAAANELPALAFTAATLGLMAWIDWRRTLLFALPPAILVGAAFLGTNYRAVGQIRPAYSEFDGVGWYDYPGSYWKKPAEGEIKYGIDWARMHESRATYAMHVLVGHHGFFSLTPLWLLALAGAFYGMRRTTEPGAEQPGAPPSGVPWFVPMMTLALSVIVIGFYLYKSDNYGGWTNGLRWLMWLTPLWLFTLIPVVDRLASWKLGRGVVYAALAMSVLSAQYSPWNPWRHPWIYDFMLQCGWPGYGR